MKKNFQTNSFFVSFFKKLITRTFFQDFLKLFGTHIRDCRKQMGLTLTQLGAQIGMDSGALSKVETGKKVFDYKLIDKLAIALKLDRSELMEELISEQIAQLILRSKCQTDVVDQVHSKILLLKQKSTKQGKLKFQ